MGYKVIPISTKEPYIHPTDLFRKIGEILRTEPCAAVNRQMHSLLAAVCHEGVRNEGVVFGNLFAQVEFLCRRYALDEADVAAIQKMRRDSNSPRVLPAADLRYDLRALSLLVSAVFSVDVPASLVALLPRDRQPLPDGRHTDYIYIRCIVADIADDTLTVTTDQAGVAPTLKVDYTEHAYLRPLLRRGMQLNLLECEMGERLRPRTIVVEPDFLVDISSVARCFADYGHHPLSYTLGRLSPSANSQAILLGNFASRALDDIISHGDGYDWHDTIRSSFRERALEYATCPDFNRQSDFKTDALRQTQNLKAIVDELFSTPHGAEGRQKARYDRTKALLEPSFVCERLGLQGRVDLMTTDLRLLVEQKSGSNFYLQSQRPNKHGSFQKEDHYVQLLLYAGVLKYNFGRKNIDLHLLYSKFPPPSGLVRVNSLQTLFGEAIALRNHIVAQEFLFASEGVMNTIDGITADTINENKINTPFFDRYIRPRIEATLRPLCGLSPVERAYADAMLTFVYREQLASKVGSHEGLGSCVADLWNTSVATKQEMGNIYTRLTVVGKEKSRGRGSYDTVTLRVAATNGDAIPNFRTGDMVYLYAYEGQPDVRNAILFKATMVDIHADTVTVHLTDGQQNPEIISGGLYAIEHAASDASHTAALRSIVELMASAGDKRNLLLSQREPTADKSRSLSRSHNPYYDEVLLKAKQARDFFLLVGPPGTGKTSMALRFMVEEALTVADASLLLMSYTNRAVDEICAMLDGAHIGYLRLGGEYACAPSLRHGLLDRQLGDNPTLATVRQTIASARVVVGTTSAMLSRRGLFDIKRFSIAIVDEASQILEPQLVGLLAHVDKFVLVGDYKQLPAVVQQEAPLSAIHHPLLQAIGLTDCRNSLFERLYQRELSLHRADFVGVLRRQGRMHPAVAAFPNEMFYRLERLQCVPLPHQKEADIYPETAAVDASEQDALCECLHRHRMVYVPSPDNPTPRMSDKVNPAEAAIVADLICRIYRYSMPHFDPAKTVGVIVPYRNQIAMVRQELEKSGIPGLEGITIDTVERYQGSQRDVIIYSFTIQNRYQLDFLTANCFEEDGHVIDRKLNVAITRARKQLIVTGNETVLRANAIFAQLIDHIRAHAGYFSPPV